MSNRMMRADAEIVRVLADIISNKLRDPRIANEIITVTKAKTSSDFRHCKVGISILSKDENKKKEVIKLLKRSSGFIKKELVENLELPYVPELVFELDENLEYSERINNILNSLQISKNDVEDDFEKDNKDD